MTAEIELRTEQRLATMITYTRVATSLFLLIPPIFAWSGLRYPMLAAGAALAAGAEAQFLRWRLRATGSTSDPVVLTVDISFCLLLMVIGAQAAEPESRLTHLTVLLPFTLVCPALVGFGVCRTTVGAALVALLGVGWTVSLYPSYTTKLASDLLGFGLWFVVARLIARELRSLARATAQAQDETHRVEKELASREREVAIERERAAAHREIHDYLLPVIQQVAAGRDDVHVRDAAAQGLARARRFLTDEQAAATAFREGVADLRLAFPDTTAVVEIGHDPPHEVGDAVLAAAREALTNARKHGGGPTNLYVRATENFVLITVRDRGPGFDPAATRRGGGLGHTFPAVEHVGGTVGISSMAGVKIVIRWPRA